MLRSFERRAPSSGYIILWHINFRASAIENFVCLPANDERWCLHDATNEAILIDWQLQSSRHQHLTHCPPVNYTPSAGKNKLLQTIIKFDDQWPLHHASLVRCTSKQKIFPHKMAKCVDFMNVYVIALHQTPYAYYMCSRHVESKHRIFIRLSFSIYDRRKTIDSFMACDIVMM